jgi:hypothetical protein
MTSTRPALSNYEDAIRNLPNEAFLGSLLWFSISQADVNLDLARAELEKAGLQTGTLRKILRPVDAFKKASRDIGKKFKPNAGIRAEILVRAVGDDGGDQAHRHLILERAVVSGGKARRISYDKVGQVVFNRGVKKDGEYFDYSVESRRTTANMAMPLTDEEEKWLESSLDSFGDRFDHLLHYMDSHAVRSFVRDYIDTLSGTCVKESGGLYFIKQQHSAEVAALGHWVRSIGSEFHSLPLLNLADQRQMIMEAFEDETVKEVERLMLEVQKILADPERQIEEKTFDSYGIRAAELSAKVQEYSDMLGDRAGRASVEISIYSQQVLALSSRIRQAKSTQAKVISS